VSSGLRIGQFELTEPIGSGGMAEVWRGTHVLSRIPVALKVVSRPLRSSPQFRNEVRAVARLDHPNIIRVFDQGDVPRSAESASGGKLVAGRPYLAMELATGGTLRTLPHRLSWHQISPLLAAILRALAHAHARGVIHRDLKPSNVLIAGPADLRAGVKLTDFGIAHALEPTGEPSPAPGSSGRDSVVGTLRYMAPEQIAGRVRDEGPWTDLYALGIMAYRLIAGQFPYGDAAGDELLYSHLRSTPAPLCPRFESPPGIEAWVRRLLAKQPVDRFASAAEALAALSELDPERLQTPPAAVPHQRLVGAGLGLFGLRPVPLIGRTAERAALRSALDAAHRTGAARVVVMKGGAGVGKSRLASWLAEAAHEQLGAVALRSSVGPFSGPRAGLERMLANHLRCIGLPRDEVRNRVTRFVADHPLEGDTDYDALALTELIIPARGEGTRVRLATPTARHRVIRRTMRRLSRGGPLVLCLDDAHHATDALDFVEYLLAADYRSPEPFVILVAVRDDAQLSDRSERILRELCNRPITDAIEIAPLPMSEHEELVEQLLGLSGELAARVATRTEGNPLFAVQLVGDWVSRGVLVMRADGFALRAGEPATVPDDIFSLWTGRVGRVARSAGVSPDIAFTALEIASCLAPEIAATEWTTACELAGIEVPPRLLDELVAERLAEWSEGGLTLCHAMFAESLERAAADSGRLPAHHRACADMLESLYDPDATGVQERRARHLIASGSHEQALAPLLASAEARRQSSELGPAHALFEEREAALEAIGAPLDDRRYADGWVRRGPCFVAEGRLEEALAVADRASAAAERHGWNDITARADIIRGAVAFNLGDSATSLAAYQRALDALESPGDRPGASRARPPSWVGETPEPPGCGRTADGPALAECLAGLGSTSVWRRELARARQCFGRLYTLHEASDDADGLGQALRGLAHIAHCGRDYEVARHTMERARKQFATAGNRRMVGSCLNDLGELARDQGDLETAEQLYRTAWSLFLSIGSSEAIVCQLNLALVLLGRRRVAEAHAVLRELASEIERGERTVEKLWVDTAMLACSAAEGDFARWDRIVERISAPIESGEFVDEDLASLSRLAAGFAQDAGQLERARRAYQLSRAQYARMDHADELARIDEALADLATSSR